MEEWRGIPSIPGLLASSLGRIKTEDRIGLMPHGGPRLYKGKPWQGSWTGKRYIARHRGQTIKVARAVCEAFHGPAPADRPVCMHLDENARNNAPENLRWGSQKENLNAPGFLAYCAARTGENSTHRRGKGLAQP